jgi:hypothetical protein
MAPRLEPFSVKWNHCYGKGSRQAEWPADQRALQSETVSTLRTQFRRNLLYEGKFISLERDCPLYHSTNQLPETLFQ